ncbi:MAG: type IV secretory system conjugative DNA transfer family protein, partial [Pseudomonadota bacterium]
TSSKSDERRSTDISPRIASRSSEMSTPTPSERRQILWDLTFLCWDRPYVSGEGAESLDWLANRKMERAMSGKGMPNARNFDPKSLKSDPNGVSLFIVMPIDDLDEYEPWLQCLFIGIFAAVRADASKPRYPILTILDEFSSLGYQDYIAKSLDNIRSSGMKIAFIWQNFGKMKKLYGDEMDSFFSNSGLELYFGRIGRVAADYLKAELGDTEVVRLARSANASRSQSDASSEAIAFGETENITDTEAAGTAESVARNKVWNWSSNIAHSDSKNWGQGRGNTMGWNYGPHVFFEGLERSTNYGTSLNTNRGGSHTTSMGQVKGGGGGLTKTISENITRSKAQSKGTSRTQTTTTTRTDTMQIGTGIAETFHKKPLLQPHEIAGYLRAIGDEERDHPAYPGLMLVRMADVEHPFFVRRSNHDQDPVFEGCFSRDPVHGLIPLSQQALLGYQYTLEHVWLLRTPAILIDEGFEFDALVRPHQWVEQRENLIDVRKPGLGVQHRARVGFAGRVMDVKPRNGGLDISMKATKPIRDADALARQMFLPLIEAAEIQRRRREELSREQELLKERELKKFEEGKKAWSDHLSKKLEGSNWSFVWMPIVGSLAIGWFSLMGFSVLSWIIGSLTGSSSHFIDRETIVDHVIYWIWLILIFFAFIAGIFAAVDNCRDYRDAQERLSDRYGPASKYGL